MIVPPPTKLTVLATTGVLKPGCTYAVVVFTVAGVSASFNPRLITTFVGTPVLPYAGHEHGGAIGSEHESGVRQHGGADGWGDQSGGGRSAEPRDRGHDGGVCAAGLQYSGSW